MSKSNLLTLILCLAGTIAFSQPAAPTIAGSPYVDDSYVDGTIHFANRHQKVPVRYNAFQDLIEYQQNGQRLVLDANPAIRKVDMGQSVIVVQKFEYKGKPKVGYLTVIDSGKATLFAKQTVIYLDAKKGGNLDGSDQPAQYKRNPDIFYFRIGDGTVEEVGNLKSLIAAFPDKQDELTAYAKKEKISVKKQKELEQLFRYYNSLQ